MDIPSHFMLEDVRCFQGLQRGRLRPITLLVGENSTGKTTFLGCYGVLHRALSTPWGLDGQLDFNQEPFVMGSFRDIVRSRRGPSGRINEFKLGLDPVQAAGGLPPYTLIAVFSEHRSQPIISSLRYEFNELDSEEFFEIRRGDAGDMILVTPGHETKIALSFNMAAYIAEQLAHDDQKGIPYRFPEARPIVDYLAGLAAANGNGPRRRTKRPGRLRLPLLIPGAPLRSKPKRTYDPVRETASPEGEHIPMLMMRLDRTDKEHWKTLHDGLVRFGRESGLFSDIKVKRHGKQMSDPFQLQIKARSGSHANIMDVGYGVSQSLPILVDVLTEKNSDFLLQQPEVHLHPRGQAELANLFVESVRQRKNRFLIETHSDYIVDRIRISVRRGELNPNSVSILYFEAKSNAVTIHDIALDRHGNLKAAPDGYRDFFHKETDRVLGFAD